MIANIASYTDTFFRREVLPLPAPVGGARPTLAVTALPMDQAGNPTPADQIPPLDGLAHFAESSGGGLYLDNTSGCYLHDLEIQNFVVDGLHLSWTTKFASVRESDFERLRSRNNGRCGVSITGPGVSLDFVDCSFDDNGGQGCDIEPLGLLHSERPIRDVSFRGCRFKGNAAGFSVSPVEMVPVQGLALSNCVIDGNLEGFVAQSDLGRLEDCTIAWCAFKRQHNRVCLIAARGSGTFLDCSFEPNLPTSNPPNNQDGAYWPFWYYWPSSDNGNFIDFRGGADLDLDWQVLGNRFEMLASVPDVSGIVIQGPKARLTVIGDYWKAANPFFLVASSDALVSTDSGTSFRGR
jgi:hypothetical protein